MEKDNQELETKRKKKLDFNVLNDKKFLLILGGIVLLAIILIALLLIFRTNEGQLKKELKEMGVSFYEDYYYDSLKKNYQDNDEGFKDYLSGFKDQGFKIDLDNLSRVNDMQDKLKDFVNSKTDEECDKLKTNIVIYPKESYGKEDYTMDVTLVCGFDKEEK